MKKRKCFRFLCACVFALVLVYSTNILNKLYTSDKAVSLRGGLYLIKTPGCTIPQMDPYDPAIRGYVYKVPDIKCHYVEPSITYQDGLWLRLNKSLFRFKFGEFGECRFKVISRVPNSDNEIVASKPVTMDADMRVSDEFLSVSCYDKKQQKRYKNFHAFAPPKNVTGQKAGGRKTKSHKAHRRPNVLFVGIDSVSRLNMVRQLNQTRDFLVRVLNSTDILGYNKVADNTFLNVVPLLANKFIAEVPFDESKDTEKPVDDIGYIWGKFAENGYLTLLAEDSPSIGTFNYLKAGFRNPPTHYYLRPFSLAMQSDKSGWFNNYYCFVDRLETQIVMDYVSDFLDTNQNNSYFAYTFLTRISHDYLNEVGGSDHIYLKFFQKLKRKGHLENTILFFFSDHGMRFGDIRNTYVGKMEERLPMMLIYLPPWFKVKYPLATKNLQVNAERLTTPFDIHYTLRDILKLNFDGRITSNKSGRGISLFTDIPVNRTCEQAAIASHWCTCQSQKEVDANDKNVQQAAARALSHINDLTNVSMCARLKLKRVNRAWQSVVNTAVLQHNYDLNGQDQSITDYQLMLTAYPGGGQFETTVRHFEYENVYWVSREISRINLYGNQSHCVKNTRLKKYCYCL